MPTLHQELLALLPPGFAIPPEFVRLYDWIEGRGLYVDSHGYRHGELFPSTEYRPDGESVAGTMVEFVAMGSAAARDWLAVDDSDAIARLCGFAQTGAEGTMAAFWLDDNGDQRIVQMGSGSGSISCCVLADTAVDFLRLLAIGHDELAWNDEFRVPPPLDPVPDFVAYRQWVVETFGVTIPACAADIVRYPEAEIGGDSPDPFCQWVNRVRESNCQDA